MGVEEQKIAEYLTYYRSRGQYFIDLDQARVNLSIPIGGYNQNNIKFITKEMGALEEKKEEGY